jgi:hypothetical protein
MNQRIAELEKQCWSHRVEGTLVDGQLHFDTTKFAELIVQDCVGIVRNQGPFLRYNAIAEAIQKHFGIKK